MKLNFLVAPDFAPDKLAGWHMLNTVLQARSGLHMHLLMPASAQEQTELVQAGQVDLIFANPFDAAHLIRELGYGAVARPRSKSDEMVMATAAASPLRCVEDVRAGHRVALTNNRDVKLIGLRLLEAADVAELDLRWSEVETHQAAARMAIKGDVELAFFLADAFHSLTRLTRSQLHVVIESAIGDISHVLLAHPRAATALPSVVSALATVGQYPNDHEVLDALGMTEGFAPMTDEDAEFMVDLMDTLLD